MSDRSPERSYGPPGWARELSELVAPWTMSTTVNGRLEFAGATYEAGRALAAHLVDAGVGGYDGMEPGDVLAAADLFGPTATFTGYSVADGVCAERVVFTSVQIDVAGWTVFDLAAATRELELLGLSHSLEHGPGHWRLTAR